MERMAYAALALLSLAYIFLGIWLGRVWGVNPSRSTARAERTGKRRGGWPVLLAGYVLTLAFLQGMLCAPAMRAGNALVWPAALALPCGVISMLALFVSVRHDGRSLPEIALERHGAWLGRGMYALGALSMVFCASAHLALLPAIWDGWAYYETLPERIAAYALLLAFCAVFPSGICAPALRSEGHIRRVGLGGVLLGFAAYALCALPDLRGTLAQRLPEETGRYASAFLCACTALCAAYLSCISAKGLFARRLLLTRKKPKSDILAPLGALVLTLLLACSGFDHLLLLAGVFGFAYALLALGVCALWLRSVGRGLLW